MLSMVRVLAMRRARFRMDVRLDSRNRSRPIRVLGLGVDFSRQIGFELLETHAIAREKIPIMQILVPKRMGEAEHQGHIRVGAHGEPLGVQEIRAHRLSEG